MKEKAALCLQTRYFLMSKIPFSFTKQTPTNSQTFSEHLLEPHPVLGIRKENDMDKDFCSHGVHMPPSLPTQMSLPLGSSHNCTRKRKDLCFPYFVQICHCTCYNSINLFSCLLHLNFEQHESNDGLLFIFELPDPIATQ